MNSEFTERHCKPRLFVRRLAIYASFSAGDCVREEVFQHGLNIVVGEAMSPHDSMSGHSVGKTSLCRLIRHCLGEPTYANPSDQQAIRDTFPAGWVGCEVEIHGIQWAVLLPFVPSRSQKPRAAQDECLADTFSLEAGENEYDDYRRVIESLQTPYTSSPWRHTLAWLTRDQGSMQRSYWDWRQTSSQSETGLPPSYEKRIVLARAVLGLSCEEEEDARHTLESLAQEISVHKEEEESRKSALLGQAQHALHILRQKTDFAWNVSLQSSKPPTLKNAKLPTLLVDSFLQKIKAQMLEAEKAWLEARSIVSEHEKRRDFYQEKIKSIQALWTTEQDTLSTMKSPQGHQSALDDLETRMALNYFCLAGKPVADCPDVQELRKAYKRRASGKELSFSSYTEKKKYDELCKVIRFYEKKQEEYEAKCALCSRDMAEAHEHEEAQYKKYNALNIKHALVKEHWDSLQYAWQRMVDGVDDDIITEAREKQRALEEEQEMLKCRVAQIQKNDRDRLTDFGQIFHTLVQRVIDNTCTGTFRINGIKSPFLIAQRQKTLKEGALKVLSNILGDIACLLASASENSMHPGFLMHDSPREAELSPELYDKALQSFVEMTEQNAQHYSLSTPVQYIVTMRGSPTEHLQKYICTRLHGAETVDDKRGLLFKRDIVANMRWGLVFS